MKINVKLGGKNMVVNGNLLCISSRPTIVFVADVTHPSPMDKTRPSIAAVVASMDKHAVFHAAGIINQGHRVEQIVKMKEMASELLKRFYQTPMLLVIICSLLGRFFTAFSFEVFSFIFLIKDPRNLLRNKLMVIMRINKNDNSTSL